MRVFVPPRPKPTPEELDRIERTANEALEAGAKGNEQTWLDAVRKVQPRFDWAADRRVRERFVLWVERAWKSALRENFLENLRIGSFALEINLARRSLQVYERNEEKLRSVLKAEQDLQLIEQFQVFSDAKWGLQGIGTVSKGEGCLVFRGTLIERIRNWELNFRIGAREPGVHGGFLFAWKKLKGQVQAWLAGLPERPRKLTITGHSLGGAIAILAAYDLKDDYAIERVATFGSPRLARPRFCDLYARAGLSEMTRRYIHSTDLVSYVVPEMFYQHVGKPFFITGGGAVAERAPEPTFQRLQGSLRDRAVWEVQWWRGKVQTPELPMVGLATVRPISWREQIRPILYSLKDTVLTQAEAHPTFLLPLFSGLGALVGAFYSGLRVRDMTRSFLTDKGEHDMGKYYSSFHQLFHNWAGPIYTGNRPPP